MSIPNPPAGAPAPQPPAPVTPVGAPPTPSKKTNVAAMVAMIVAIVGFVFACIPGALIVGWFLLPIAFILSIVSLFLKGDRKWMGIVGLIVAVVGTIVGFIVFFAVVATSFNEAFGSGETTVSQPVDKPADAQKAVEADKPADAAEQGTRENPYPLASKISSDDWTVVVNSVNPDGDAVVAKANQFNDKAPAGSHYEIVNYTVTYTGDDKGLAAEVQVDLVTSAGNVVNSYDHLVVLKDGFGLDELYNGAAATGSVAFVVPDGDEALIRVTPGMFADEVFVKP